MCPEEVYYQLTKTICSRYIIARLVSTAKTSEEQEFLPLLSALVLFVLILWLDTCSSTLGDVNPSFARLPSLLGRPERTVVIQNGQVLFVNIHPNRLTGLGSTGFLLPNLWQLVREIS